MLDDKNYGNWKNKDTYNAHFALSEGHSYYIAMWCKGSKDLKLKTSRYLEKFHFIDAENVNWCALYQQWVLWTHARFKKSKIEALIYVEQWPQQEKIYVRSDEWYED